MNQKQIAGEKAAEYIKNGMTVGLGTGSTVYYTILKVGAMVQDGLQIQAVSTSKSTSDLAKKLGIPMVDLNEVSEIDLTIDGADEVDSRFQGIKGGGGALLFEKLVATASKKNIWVVDSSKVVEQLGKFPLPVEVIPFGAVQVQRKLEVRGWNPVLRMIEGKVYHTDSGNVIYDLQLNQIADPKVMAAEIIQIPGVVEHGLFLDIADIIVVGKETTVDVIYNRIDESMEG